MSELNKLDLNWIDSSNEDQREQFLDALNSYLLFKKDSLDKCNLLIEENPNFNAPKLLKIILILLTRDNNKIIDAKILLGNINIENLNDHFKNYLISHALLKECESVKCIALHLPLPLLVQSSTPIAELWMFQGPHREWCLGTRGSWSSCSPCKRNRIMIR